jgi:6-phosphogluconate dehydrogenase (decarboxylating)
LFSHRGVLRKLAKQIPLQEVTVMNFQTRNQAGLAYSSQFYFSDAEASGGADGCSEFGGWLLSGTRETVPNLEYITAQIIPAIGRVIASQTIMGSCHVTIINIAGIDHRMMKARNACLEKLVLISTPHVGQRRGVLYGQRGTP